MPKDTNREINQRVKSLRKQLGFTQEYIANCLQIKRSTYQYEETKGAIPIEHLRQLATIFHVDMDALLNGTDDTSDNQTSSRFQPDYKKPTRLNDFDIFDLSGSGMRIVSKEEAELIDDFNKLPDAEKKLILEFIKSKKNQSSSQ